MTYIKTYAQLAAIIKPFVETAPLGSVETTVDAEVERCCMRFCAAQEAEVIQDMNRREMINLLQDGFKGYHTPQDVEDYLATMGTYESEEDDCPTEEVVLELVKQFFGSK